MELEPEPELKLFKSRNRNRFKSQNRNHNFSKVGTGIGTVKNSYGSTTLLGRDIFLLARRILFVAADQFVSVPLKVGGNEKNGGSGRSQMLDNGLGPWRSRFIFNLNMQFLSKMSYFRFRL
jgi:hypothetical protein